VGAKDSNLEPADQEFADTWSQSVSFRARIPNFSCFLSNLVHHPVSRCCILDERCRCPICCPGAAVDEAQAHRPWRRAHRRANLHFFWKYFRNAFARDAGLRIDHLLLSLSLKNRVVAGGVAREVRSWEKTSYHAQAWIELKDIVQSGSGRKRGIDGEET
jgi:hypothetical protein